MKVYKSKPNEYGWYYVIHITKDLNDIKIFKKCTIKDKKNYEESINIWGDGIELLLTALNDWEEKAK